MAKDDFDHARVSVASGCLRQLRRLDVPEIDERTFALRHDLVCDDDDVAFVESSHLLGRLYESLREVVTGAEVWKPVERKKVYAVLEHGTPDRTAAAFPLTARLARRRMPAS
jgi:hypothetical protein